MTGGDIAFVLKYALLGWLFALTAIVAVQVLRGDINTNGMMLSANGKDIDPERLALVLLTLSAAGFYVVQTLGTPLDELKDTKTGDYSMPDFPGSLLALLGGSQSAYLTGKLLRPTMEKGS